MFDLVVVYVLVVLFVFVVVYVLIVLYFFGCCWVVFVLVVVVIVFCSAVRGRVWAHGHIVPRKVI